MNNNFDDFKDKVFLIESYNLGSKTSREQAFRNTNLGYIDPHLRIKSDYPSGIVEYDILQESVSALQKLAQSTYNYVFGSKTNKGKLPKHVIDDSKLLITGMSAGSFVVTFDSAVNKLSEINSEKQIKLTEDKSSIELLLEVIEDIVEMDTEKKSEEFLKKYGTRTFRESSNFVNMVKNKDINLEIGFGFRDNQVINIKKEKVLNTIDLFEHIKISSTISKENFSGKLTGVSNKKRELTFEDSGKYVIVKVLDDSLDDYKMITTNIYNFEVNIKVESDIIQDKVINTEYFINTVKYLR